MNNRQPCPHPYDQLPYEPDQELMAEIAGDFAKGKPAARFKNKDYRSGVPVTIETMMNLDGLMASAMAVDKRLVVEIEEDGVCGVGW